MVVNNLISKYQHEYEPQVISIIQKFIEENEDEISQLTIEEFDLLVTHLAYTSGINIGYQLDLSAFNFKFKRD